METVHEINVNTPTNQPMSSKYDEGKFIYLQYKSDPYFRLSGDGPCVYFPGEFGFSLLLVV